MYTYRVHSRTFTVTFLSQHPPSLSIFYQMTQIQRHRLIKRAFRGRLALALFSIFCEGRGIHFGGKDDQPSPCSLPSVRGGGFSLAERIPALALFSTFHEGRGIFFGGKDDQPSPCSLPSVRGGGFSLAARTASLRLVLYLP